MKSVCSSPTANHLTSFPVTAVTAALGSGKARPAGCTRTPLATGHPRTPPHPGRGTLPSCGTVRGQGESTQRTPWGHLPPTLTRDPNCPDRRPEGLPFPTGPSPSLLLETPVPRRPAFRGCTILRKSQALVPAPQPFLIPPKAWLAMPPSPRTQHLGSAPLPRQVSLALTVAHPHPKRSSSNTPGRPSCPRDPPPTEWLVRGTLGQPRGRWSWGGRGPHPAQRGSPPGGGCVLPAPPSLRLGARATTQPLFS